MRITERKTATDRVLRELASMMAKILGMSENEAYEILASIAMESGRGSLITEKFKGSIKSSMSYEELERAYYEMKG